ncbi:MAG: Mrp/NBP35 family ATP-binding protein [Anaerolineae bacterium]|nr:Mrp/NBP35 family ATP-binding protein [Anaerolineae bacterium]MBT4310416.1 Mrp/NBP35 family ATP-binding protein [Anaerolineae bacterium]MBT4456868.1 Mrp/NBP35 family ATP-binding protein [Anaerolineae bacterium]MBT4842840.1 Mrp/NBP35 family ATP-binding protein [Anaerolineae bacterium]MBT6061076.1 Mrp/NBP35 family ATP-binding protein [Anaerolineae bacterium]
MTQITKDAILAALSNVMDPDLHKDLVTLNMIRDVVIEGDTVNFSIFLTTPACPLKGKIEADARQAVEKVDGVKTININMDADVPNDGRMRGLVDSTIRNAIAVGSGKGGVGKSTVAVNLAVSLAKSGASVGLLDADIYGPNIPTMMGVDKLPPATKEKLMPAEAHGVKVMSMGFLVKPGQPLIWRGAMLHSAIRQFLTDVEWGELDYLIVDLPPGTGDAPLTLAQSFPLSGAILVTLPQIVSLEDASRGLGMFEKLEVPLMGVIENMTGDVFGHGGGESLAESAGIPFLGSVPMNGFVRLSGDQGQPVVIAQPDSDAAKAMQEIAETVAQAISIAALDEGAKNAELKINITD